MGIIQLGSSSPSFEDPIAMLLACHDKIRRFCTELSLLPEHLSQHGWDDVAVASAKRRSNQGVRSCASSGSGRGWKG